MSHGLSGIRGLLCAALLSAAGCSEGALVTLGEQRESVETETVFGNIRKLWLADSDQRDENPTLTDDMLEIFFERDDGANGIWHARRESINVDFPDPQPLASWGADGSYSSPAISFDGKTLWVAWKADDAENDATTDIHFATRIDGDVMFTEPQEAVGEGNWNTEWDERPRPLGDQGRVMPFSRRVDTDDAGQIWQTWFARRNQAGSFEAPQILEGVEAEDVGIVDGFLSQDGLIFMYKREAGGADLYWTQRWSTDEPFPRGTEVIGVNTDKDERDPWLSSDRRTLYFASNREDNKFHIYQAELVTRPVSD